MTAARAFAVFLLFASGLAAAVALAVPDAAGSVFVAAGAVGGCIFALLVLARVESASTAAVLASPASIAAATWLLLFVIRPVELSQLPWHAARGLGQFGFDAGDLVATTALAAIGCVCWTAAYAGALKLPASSPRVPERSSAFSGRGAAAALAVGTLLWTVLFVRQGGPGALAESAVSVREGQNASFHGFIGVWLVQGTTLYAFAVWLERRSRAAGLTLFAGVPISVAASLALQLRALAVFAAFAAFVIFIRTRRIRPRHVVVGALVLPAAFLVLGLLQQTREYTHRVSTPEAARLVADTPLWAMYVSDLSTFDSFVAIRQLVPDATPYLRGESIAEIPQALLPRAVWPEKPLGLDERAGRLLYPGTGVANPVSLQGELYWNGGLPVVAFGAAVLGLLFGLLARFGRDLDTDDPTRLVLYAVAVPFTFAFLTRGLAITTAGLVLAVIGTGLAIIAVSPGARDALRRALPERPRAEAVGEAA